MTIFSTHLLFRAALLVSVFGPTAGLCAQAQAAVVPATIIAQPGDPAVGSGLPAGTTILSVNTPFTDAIGKVGFVGQTAGALDTRYVWYDTGVIWTNATASGNTLAGQETGSMGVGQCGQFVYSCDIDTNDGVWTHAGRLLADSDPAPGIPGKFISFASRPVMSGNGVIGIIAGLSNSSTGATVGRAFYQCSGTTPGSCVPILQTGGSVAEGANLYPLGVNPGPDISFESDISDNGQHRMNILRANYPAGNTASRQVVTKNNQVVVKVGDAPAGGTLGTRYSQFQVISVNNAGDTLVGGFAGASTGVLVHNGVVLLEDIDPLAGIPNIFALRVDAGGLANNGKVLLIASFTDINSSSYRVLVLGDVAQPTPSWQVLARVGDVLDTNGDSVGDEDLVAVPTPLHRSLDLPDDGSVYVLLNVRNIATGTTRDAVVKLCVGCPVGTPCDSIDFNGDGVSPDSLDIDDFLSVFGGGVCSNDPFCNDIDFNNDCVSPDSGDIDNLLTVFGGGSCP